MKECTGDYKYKGFLIGYSYYYQEWTIEPYFFYKEEDDVKAINYANEFRNEHEGFKTINQAKRYIKENEQRLKEEILEGYKNY